MNVLNFLLCLIVGHDWQPEMSCHETATAGWLRCPRCKTRL